MSLISTLGVVTDALWGSQACAWVRLCPFPWAGHGSLLFICKVGAAAPGCCGIELTQVKCFAQSIACSRGWDIVVVALLMLIRVMLSLHFFHVQSWGVFNKPGTVLGTKGAFRASISASVP